MGECVLTRRSVVKNEYQLLADITISGSAVTQVNISGLNIGKGEEIMLVSDIVNTTAFSPTYSLFANGNNVQTQYHRQYIYCSASAVSAGRANSNELSMCSGNSKSFTNSKIKITNNSYFIIQTNEIRDYSPTTHTTLNQYVTSTFTITNITSLKIEANVSNAIGIGSRFQLYRVGGA